MVWPIPHHTRERPVTRRGRYPDYHDGATDDPADQRPVARRGGHADDHLAARHPAHERCVARRGRYPELDSDRRPGQCPVAGRGRHPNCHRRAGHNQSDRRALAGGGRYPEPGAGHQTCRRALARRGGHPERCLRRQADRRPLTCRCRNPDPDTRPGHDCAHQRCLAGGGGHADDHSARLGQLQHPRRGHRDNQLADHVHHFTERW
ncbi:Uncharacterised protein [Mycobacteroides abscessus subsp. bolletii]|nr:Uncharacterised protein [Mycobacteroides abscessus subsp. bolletii]